MQESSLGPLILFGLAKTSCIAEYLSKADKMGQGGDATRSLVQDRSNAHRTYHETSPTKSVANFRGLAGKSTSRHLSSSPQKLSPGNLMGPSPEKVKSRAWNSLWSLDYNSESGKEKR